MRDISRRGLIFGGATLGGLGLLFGVQRVLSSAFAGDEPTPTSDDPSPVTVIRFTDAGDRIAPISEPRVRKTKQEWKKQLRRRAMTLRGAPGPSGLLAASSTSSTRRDCIGALAATTRCLIHPRNLTLEPVGRASGNRSPMKTSTSTKIFHLEWFVAKFCAGCATRTWVTCSPMALSRPVCVIA
jgi:hypothetical protein